MNARATSWFFVGCLVVGCGGSGHSADSPPTDVAPGAAPSSPASADAGMAAASTTAASTNAPTPAPDTATSAAADDSSADAEKSKKRRDISYRMTPEGLVIDVEGVELEPKAEPIKVHGAWTVKITVVARATDDKPHQLLASAEGPLMIATEADRGGKKDRAGDERKDESEKTLSSDPVNFERKLKVSITKGQSLSVFVGLWGLGHDEKDRRPVKKLFLIKMVAGEKAAIPVVSPPE